MARPQVNAENSLGGGVPRTRRGEETRQRILASAARSFAELGYRRTRFEDVSDGAGVSRALIYTYFPNKEMLLRAVRDHSLAGWRDAVAPAMEQAAGPAEALGAMVRTTLHYARTRPFLRALLADDSRVVMLDRDGLGRGAIDEWRSRAMELLEQGVTAGEFHSDLDIPHTADVLRAMQLGVIDRMHRPDAPIDVSRPEHVEAAADLMLRGVLGRKD